MTYPLYIYDFNLNNPPIEIPVNYTDEIIKKEIIPEIQPRDFNLLDKSNNYKISSLIIRKSGYLLKLYYFRCIVTTEKAYIFNIDHLNNLNFINFYKNSFNNNKIISIGLPPELRFLELLLIYICNQTDITINQLSELVSQISFENIKNSKLKNILNLQSRLNYAEQEYLEINHVISDLISSKEDMFDLYLSKKSEDLENINKEEEAKLDEFEILLENYQSQLNEDINHIKKLVKEVEIKLKLADISLADFRNKIALYNTQISIYSITISFASFFAAIFGMNLTSHLENLTAGLYVISFIIFIMAALFFYFIYSKLEIIIRKLDLSV